MEGCDTGTVNSASTPPDQSRTTVTAYYTLSEPIKLHVSKSQESHGRCCLQYFDEGGANIIFAISPMSKAEPLHYSLDIKLLRLRKNLPYARRTEQQLNSFNQHFSNMFPRDTLIENEIIELEPDTILALNATLQHLLRPANRSKDFLPLDEMHGLLITDMRHLVPDDLTLQFKPKWLAQSPNAPAGSRRCRTCALRAQRFAQGCITATDKQAQCPLAFVHSDSAIRRQAANAVSLNGLLQHSLVVECLPLLRRLRDLQRQLDPEGILRFPAAGTPMSLPHADLMVTDQSPIGERLFDLCRAMTLRDCTLYILLRGHSMHIRLGDLDLKQPEKFDRWREVERDLVNGGWYLNTEAPSMWSGEKICLMSKGPL